MTTIRKKKNMTTKHMNRIYKERTNKLMTTTFHEYQIYQISQTLSKNIVNFCQKSKEILRRHLVN